MRPLYGVVKAMLSVIPDDYENKWALEKSLNAILEMSAYTAPECMAPYWKMAVGALESGMKDAHDQGLSFADTVRDICNDKLDYRKFQTGSGA